MEIQAKIRGAPLTGLYLKAPSIPTRTLSQSLKDRCRACAAGVYEAWRFAYPDQTENHHSFQDDSDYTWIAEQYERGLGHLDTSFDRFVLIPSPTGGDVSKKSVLARSKLWVHWLETCSMFHQKCSKALQQIEGRRGTPGTLLSPSLPPDRLLEISKTDVGATFAWKLTHGKDLVHVKYMTLSHCWGKSQPLKLTRKNYASMFELKSCSALPRTFRQVIHVAHTLGSRYIWIDSLCIIQDDFAD